LLHAHDIYGSLSRSDATWVSRGVGYVCGLPRTCPTSHEDEAITLKCINTAEEPFFEYLGLYGSSLAPDLDGQPLYSASSDIYQWAALFYYAIHGQELVSFAGSSPRASFPPNTPQADELSDLIGSCLGNPSNRPSVSKALQHRLFNRNLSSGFPEAEDATVKKVSAFKQFRQYLRNAEGRWQIQVTRTSIVDTVLVQFSNLTDKACLLRKLRVKFHEEEGIDAGGLTKEMFTVFFSALTDTDCELLESDTDSPNPTFLPVKATTEDGQARLSLYEALGRVIAKAILEDIPIPARFHPVLFRALLSGTDISPNLHELQAFCPTSAQSCRDILACEDVSLLYLSFEDEDGGQDVTRDNVKEYVQRKAERELLGQRVPFLKAMQRGFNDIPLAAHLCLFSVFDLMSVVCGKETVSADELVPFINFTGFSRGSSIPENFRQLIREMTSNQRMRFLSFVTASTALPRNDRRITIGRVDWGPDRFPLAHTCFDRLDTPEYPDYTTLKEKILWCLDNLEMSGFGMA